MLNTKYILLLLPCCCWLLYRIINIKENCRCSGSSIETRLKSRSGIIFRENLYHSSMVHNMFPVSLQFWVQNKTGFEIGGPSAQTWGHFGVYDAADRVDVTNFASETLWESGLTDGSPFNWKNRAKGRQYIRDAVNLNGISDDFYDFTMASHVLEHIANPFKALLEWLRITKPYGFLLLILPNKERTFDHKRAITSLQHLINDYWNETSEADLSHLNEILPLHDLPMDPPAGDAASFKKRSEKNPQNRALHQHVYDQRLLYYMFVYLNVDIKVQYTWEIHHLIIVQKR